MPSDQTFVIVGASLAGARAAETLREEGFDGRVVLIGAEPELPYERPPLSKEYLRGEADGKPFVHDEAFYAEKDIDLRLGTTVTGLDATARTVTLESGDTLRFDKLLLTTGAEPRRLPVPGGDLDGLHYLRTTADSDRLRAGIEQGGRLVVVGAGWIGSEVAASARQKGMEVTVIDPLAVPLERVLGPEVGGVFRDIHADHGVQLLMGTGVDAFEGSGRVERVRTSDGKTLDADLVVVGIGVVPRTQLAEAAGLEVDNGVLVDAHLRSRAENVFAAGDVANQHHPFYDARVRVEHWANALNQAPAAAKSMLGGGEEYDTLPYFFSDQYDVGMEYTGFSTDWDRVVFRGDPTSREFIAFWLEGGRVVAGMNVNVWDVTDHIQAIIRSRQPVDEQRLTDPDVPLEQLAQG